MSLKGVALLPNLEYLHPSQVTQFWPWLEILLEQGSATCVPPPHLPACWCIGLVHLAFVPVVTSSALTELDGFSGVSGVRKTSMRLPSDGTETSVSSCGAYDVAYT